MKSRFGYVSNSSSSSFLVYGVPTEDFDDVKQWLDEGRKVYCIDEGAGASGDCADFVFLVTPERYELLGQYKKELEKRHVAVICADFVGVECLDEVKEHGGLSGGMFFHYYRDYKSPSTDSVDDEDFVEWIKYRLGGK